MRLRASLMVYVLSILIVFSLSACSWCTKIEYRDVPYEVLVPVPCEIKKVSCHVSGNDTDVVVGLVECIVDLNQEIKRCQP